MTETNGQKNAFGLMTPFTWSVGEMPTVDATQWLRTQLELLAAAVQFGQEAMRRAHTEIETAGGIMLRMATARTAEDVVACQRDMIELVSAAYFEQMVALGQRMHGALTSETEKKREPAEDMLLKEKRAA